jgi:hypothetical protein
MVQLAKVDRPADRWGGIRNHYVPPGKRAFHFLKTRMRGVAEHVQLRDWSSVLGFRLQHKLASEPATV